MQTETTQEKSKRKVSLIEGEVSTLAVEVYAPQPLMKNR